MIYNVVKVVFIQDIPHFVEENSRLLGFQFGLPAHVDDEDTFGGRVKDVNY